MTDGHLDVNGQLPARTPPYDYTASLIGVGPSSGSMTVTRSACPDPMYDNTQVPVGLSFTALDTQGSRRSADGLDYTGTASQSVSGLNNTCNWSLHGTP